MSKQVVNPEYLRRNLMVCKAVGANANAKAALKRLKAQRRPAKWLVAYLEGIIDRTEGLPNELACYRAVVPNYLPVRTEGADQIVAEIMDGIESSALQHSGDGG